jgi:glycosyltransferase involved in cell wall biosynthesis
MDKFLFISNYTLTNSGLSGGDRILSELIKNWSRKYDTALYGSGECIEVLKKYKSIDRTTVFLSSSTKRKVQKYNNFNYFFHTLNRTFYGLVGIFKYKDKLSQYNHIYSASDFYPDVLPAFALKILFPKTKWIAGFYLFAPKPWQKINPYRTSVFRYITGVLYWLTQLLSYSIVFNFADFVCVTSEPDIKMFESKRRSKKKIIVVRGGVNLQPSHRYLSKHTPNNRHKKYLAVFLGRLHFQKGILELIDIWKKVCQKNPTAQLAIIGNGQLQQDIEKKIISNKLSKNVTMFGFMDGIEKFRIFKKSTIVVHPATYDSGGMATAEAMAWGLPGVSFDLESLRTYYPEGILKTKCFDLDSFSENIIKLTTNPRLYAKMSKQAINLIEKQWSWDSRSQDIISQILK